MQDAEDPMTAASTRRRGAATSGVVRRSCSRGGSSGARARCAALAARASALRAGDAGLRWRLPRGGIDGEWTEQALPVRGGGKWLVLILGRPPLSSSKPPQPSESSSSKLHSQHCLLHVSSRQLLQVGLSDPKRSTKIEQEVVGNRLRFFQFQDWSLERSCLGFSVH